MVLWLYGEGCGYHLRGGEGFIILWDVSVDVNHMYFTIFCSLV